MTRLGDSSPKFGRRGSGMPAGMSPASPTRATLDAPASTTTTVGTASATSALITRPGVHDITSKMASAPSPVSSEATSIRPGWMTTLRALASGNPPCAVVPVRSGICPQTMLTATPVKNPVITE